MSRNGSIFALGVQEGEEFTQGLPRRRPPAVA